MVLLVRSKFGFFFSCMVGTTQVSLHTCGTYHTESKIKQRPIVLSHQRASNLTNYQEVDYG